LRRSKGARIRLIIRDIDFILCKPRLSEFPTDTRAAAMTGGISEIAEGVKSVTPFSFPPTPSFQ